MDIDALAKEVRNAIAKQPIGEDGGYSAEVRAAAVRYAQECRQRGETWMRTGSRVSISPTTLRHWLLKATETKPNRTKLVPVVLEEDSPAKVRTVQDDSDVQPVIVSPSGFRLEGLSLGEAIRAMRALS